MFQPLILGNLTFNSNIIQGPLAGVSCAPFRMLTWTHGKPAFSCTEMISCKTLIHKSLQFQQRFIKIDEREGPVCFQLSSNNPEELGEATKRVTDHGASLIDLNCGCPVKKIRSKGAGSGLLTNPTLLYQLIRAMKDNTHCPVSIKIRVEGGSTDQFNQQLVDVIHDAGADFVTVHGRHWTEHYETPCNHEQIEFFVKSLKLPVIGNGDVADLASLKTMFATGAAGVMIGRAGVGQPWLCEQLRTEFAGLTFERPNPSMIGELYLQHIRELCDLIRNEKFSILQARKFAKYYARLLPLKAEFCEQMNICENFSDFEKLCLRYFN